MEDVTRLVTRSKILFRSSFWMQWGEWVDCQGENRSRLPGEEAITAFPTGDWWLRPGWSQNNGKRKGMHF